MDRQLLTPRSLNYQWRVFHNCGLQIIGPNDHGSQKNLDHLRKFFCVLAHPIAPHIRSPDDSLAVFAGGVHHSGMSDPAKRIVGHSDRHALAVKSGQAGPAGGVAPLAVTALGIVFGDIGTSPLYSLKTVFELAGGKPSPESALGLLSLVIWTLLIVTSIKYVTFVMCADNDGEGGILALMSLLGVKRRYRPGIVAIGLFGAALIYGDGAITPAISVLSALEGLKMVTPVVTPFVLPASVVILVVLFAVQSQGTARIGRVFGPTMGLWFISIALLGLWGVMQHPGVLMALDPRIGLAYTFTHGHTSLLVLGGVFLCVTGAEALYADMGHVGAAPIRLAWYALVLPSLLLNYAGQTALVLAGGPIQGNIFYRLCPTPLLLPLVVLATVATIIASQSIITGAFSMTRQAMQLGLCPRLKITQTSSEGYGQIYVGAVNWLLMIVTAGLTVGFGTSDRLAAAYGIAVSLTMLLTTTLLFVAMREVWRWNLALSTFVAGVFFCVEATFAVANLLKVADGGWVPLTLAAAVYIILTTWHRGTVAVSERLRSLTEPADQFIARITAAGVPRVPGTAVFITRTTNDVPSVMVWHVKQNRALHRQLIALTMVTESTPWIAEEERLTVEPIAPEFWRGTARYGFMETPDIQALMREAKHLGCAFDLNDVTYYVGHETIFRRKDRARLPLWRERLFAFLQRNSAHLSEFINLPRDAVVEIGREIEV
jgi:KUP system potassium uptake protein